MPTSPELLAALDSTGVTYRLVGSMHRLEDRYGADTRVCYARSRDNQARLVNALAPLAPYLRGEELEDLPFFFDMRTLGFGANFALGTDLGPIDVLGDILGVGDYAAFCAHDDALMRANFGRLRSLMQRDALDADARAELWHVMGLVEEVHPEVHRDQWIPYLASYTRHWFEPVASVSTPDELARAVARAPFAWFRIDASGRHVDLDEVQEWVSHSCFARVVAIERAGATFGRNALEHLVSSPNVSPRLSEALAEASEA